MTKLIVCVFNWRRDANAARERLLQRGFEDVRIRVAGGETAAATAPGTPAKEPTVEYKEDRGWAGAIERMFSGLLLDNDEVARYAHAVNTGKCVVALHVADDAAAARAVSILDQVGGEIARPVVADDNGPLAETSPLGSGKGSYQGLSEFDIAATVSGPRIYPLPNSPTGWGEATQGEKSSIGDIMNDPGRPEGLMRDAGGLGTDADRGVVGKKATPPSRASRGKRK